MVVSKFDDHMISALGTTMSGLAFAHDPNSGLVRASTEEDGLEACAAESENMVELTPPPTPTRGGGLTSTAGTANSLPLEIVCLILGFVGASQQDVFAATSKVSRLWYHASTPFLYRRPRISGKNYARFVTTISPSSINIKPSPLGSFVKRLDLSALVHEGKPSHNARLLRRVQSSLEELIAPQSSFGYNCIVALGHCKRLRVLDLSLVSQAVNLDDLFRHIGGLPEMTSLNFPRSTTLGHQTRFLWPRRLERFSLSGSILDFFLHETMLPESLHQLHISHCPFAKTTAVICLISALSAQLTSLSITFPMPCLASNALDNVLELCPNLTYLLVAVDYISTHFFERGMRHPLRQLDLDSSGQLGVALKVGPDDVFIAVAEERLPALRVVRVNRLLKWVERQKEDVDDLVEILEAVAAEAGEREEEVGVWEFRGTRGNGFGGGVSMMRHGGGAPRTLGSAALVNGLFMA